MTYLTCHVISHAQSNVINDFILMSYYILLGYVYNSMPHVFSYNIIYLVMRGNIFFPVQDLI